VLKCTHYFDKYNWVSRITRELYSIYTRELQYIVVNISWFSPYISLFTCIFTVLLNHENKNPDAE